jgi:hypothetical protein
MVDRVNFRTARAKQRNPVLTPPPPNLVPLQERIAIRQGSGRALCKAPVSTPAWP